MDVNMLVVETHLSWQCGVVLVLLLLPIFLSKFLQSIPRDLLFTAAALLSALCGIVSSSQLYQAGTNQAIFTVFGLWLIGKAMQEQGIFEACAVFLVPTKRGLFNRVAFFCQVIVFGAFLHHRYFPLSTLRPLLRIAEKEKGDLSLYGFPFAALFLLGGLATAIGTPTNILLLTLYSFSVKDVLSQFFLFLPFAVLPILCSNILLFLSKKQFRKPFSQFIDAAACAVVHPDSLLIGKTQPLTVVREGKPISKPTPLQSGDLILFTKAHTKIPFSQIALFSGATLIAMAHWKKIIVILLFFGSIVSVLTGVPIGTAFLSAGVILLLIRPFALKKALRDEFPLSPLLEIFSAYLFFLSMQSSGLHTWIASFIPLRSPFLLLTLI